MRILILAAAVGAVALPASANAQYWGGNNRVRQEQRECQRELRHADSRREYQRELRECRREIAQARRQQYRGGYGYRDDRYDRDDRYRDGYRGRYR
jgi:Ni/Co efflux regulator RcnB